ncbi:hypothetical protein ACVIIV_003224 [Bradyrhizobium sp. USDA 4354]
MQPRQIRQVLVRVTVHGFVASAAGLFRICSCPSLVTLTRVLVKEKKALVIGAARVPILGGTCGKSGLAPRCGDAILTSIDCVIDLLHCSHVVVRRPQRLAPHWFLQPVRKNPSTCLRTRGGRISNVLYIPATRCRNSGTVRGPAPASPTHTGCAPPSTQPSYRAGDEHFGDHCHLFPPDNSARRKLHQWVVELYLAIVHCFWISDEDQSSELLTISPLASASTVVVSLSNWSAIAGSHARLV